ncbi:MAG: sn-glycerol-3-phosphate ABC transporter ATP-binding protein UgpC [Phycisphaeraceae bacterium]
MAQVRIDNVSKIYPGDVKAVDDLTLHIRDKEFIVLVGPSGCGKSTTLRMVAGLEEISAGTVRIGERVVNDVPPKDRDIAMVFQNYALYPHMTVYKNMAFGLKLRRMPRKEIDERVQWAAKILGLTPLLERKPKALSGGQRQRVAVGRAIVRQPKAFLFDEPLSNLDAKLRVETRAELKRLHQRLQTTTIYVTHDQEEAMTLGDRVVVMDGGLLQQCDTPLSIYNAPVNRFVAGFLGTPPMNFLDGQLVQENSATWFQTQGVNVRLMPEQAEAAAGFIGGQVVLGIRPETLKLQSDGAAAPGEAAGQTISVKVSVVEPLGASMDVFGMTEGDVRLVARVPARREALKAEQLNLRLDLQHVHVFEPGTHGRNLTLPIAEAIAAGDEA